MKNRNKFAKITVLAAAGALVLSALPVSAEDADVREIKVAVAGGCDGVLEHQGRRVCVAAQFMVPRVIIAFVAGV